MTPQTQTVVVIDDDIEIRTLMELALAKPGRAVVCFGDGAAAAEFILSHERVDCVVSDVRMAGMDGFGLLARIERDGRASGTPMIFVSADDAAPERLISAAANVEYMRKPFDVAELRAKVDAGASRRLSPAPDFTASISSALDEARKSGQSVAVLVVASDGGAQDANLAPLTRSCLRRSDIAGHVAPYACAILLTGLAPGRAQELGRSVASRLRAPDGAPAVNPRVGLGFADDCAGATAAGLLDAARAGAEAPEAHAAGLGVRRADR